MLAKIFDYTNIRKRIIKSPAPKHNRQCREPKLTKGMFKIVTSFHEIVLFCMYTNTTVDG